MRGLEEQQGLYLVVPSTVSDPFDRAPKRKAHQLKLAGLERKLNASRARLLQLEQQRSEHLAQSAPASAPIATRSRKRVQVSRVSDASKGASLAIALGAFFPWQF